MNLATYFGIAYLSATQYRKLLSENTYLRSQNDKQIQAYVSVLKSLTVGAALFEMDPKDENLEVKIRLQNSELKTMLLEDDLEDGNLQLFVEKMFIKADDHKTIERTNEKISLLNLFQQNCDNEANFSLIYEPAVNSGRSSLKSGISSMYYTEGGQSQSNSLIFEASIRKLDIDSSIFSNSSNSSNQYIFLINNISHVLENQTMQVHSYYQEAMLATISHE